MVAAPPDIDASNAGWLRAVLLEAADRGDATFVVDMTATQFCDSAGLGVMVRAHKRALVDGGELRLVIPASAMVRRVFALTGVDRVIPNFHGQSEALEPAPAAAGRPPRRRRRTKPGMRARATGRRPIPAPAPARPDGPPRSRARLAPRPAAGRLAREVLMTLGMCRGASPARQKSAAHLGLAAYASAMSRAVGRW